MPWRRLVIYARRLSIGVFAPVYQNASYIGFGFLIESTQPCEADFQPGSYGYRRKRTGHQAVARVAEAIVQHKTRVIDLDLANYFGAPG
jgi:hypothetical protein